MTATEIAGLLNARPAGRGKWVGKCPSHPDHSPSLSIASGQNGRVLVRCWAGCHTEAVLEFVGRRMADLFDGPSPTSEQVRKTTLERAQREDEALRVRRERGALADRHRRLTSVCDALAARIATMSDGAEGDALAKLFHETLAKVRLMEESFQAEESQRFHERVTRGEQKSGQFREAA